MIRVLIIGLGNIGLGYDLFSKPEEIFTHTKACLLHDEVELLGGVDFSEKNRKSFEKFAGFPAFKDVKAFSLENLSVDLVIMATPPKERLSLLKECLALNPRVVLMEKPLADDYEAGLEMVELCEKQGVELQINYFRRFDPGLKELKDFIQTQPFGLMKQAHVHYSGGLLENASHMVNLFQWWFGEPCSADKNSDQIFSLNYQDFKVFFFSVEADYALCEVDLLFQSGRIRFHQFCESYDIQVSKKDPFFPDYQRLQALKNTLSQPQTQQYQIHVLADLVLALTKEHPLNSSGRLALKTLKLCLEASLDLLKEVE